MNRYYKYCVHYFYINYYANGTAWQTDDICETYWGMSADSVRNQFSEKHPSCNQRKYIITSITFCG